ncbi:MAG: hypothetical protein IMZ52_00320 [Actinobacteria bacterium]|nr:hypothetical protein [Actinomycetota bacterium]
MIRPIGEKVFGKNELLHGKHLWDMSLERTASVTRLREELRELLRLAAEVVITEDYDREQAIGELESFLR